MIRFESVLVNSQSVTYNTPLVQLINIGFCVVTGGMLHNSRLTLRSHRIQEPDICELIFHSPKACIADAMQAKACIADAMQALSE